MSFPNLDGGEARVRPPVNIAIVHEPSQLPLRENSIHKIDLSVCQDVDDAQAHLLLQPMILLITVIVLSGTQRMRHTLNRVHNRASEVVCGVRLVLCAGAVVGRVVKAIQDGISHCAVRAGHVNFGTEAVLRKLRLSPEKLLEELFSKRRHIG